jgi:hypothetical protein
METTTCPLCARPRMAADARGLAWSSERGPHGAVSWICPSCTRSWLIEIETLVPLVALDGAGDPPAAGRLIARLSW